MRRRSRASSKLANARSRKAKASKAVRPRSSSPAGQESEVVRLTRELDDAREQQAATTDVLKVISHSTFDLQAVLDTLVKSAARLCEADMVGINRPRDGAMRFAANFGLPREFEEIAKRNPFVPGRGTVVGRVLLAGKPVQIADVEADPEYTFTEGQRVAGYRTILGVPLQREGESIGVIVLIRTKVHPFTDKQIELAQNFAAQAVIAIENTRLLNELRQSLEQQTATSEVLGVISSSPGELAPVFQSMLENAVHICQASFGNLLLYEDGAFRHVALYNAPEAWAAEQQRDPVAPRRSARFLYRVADTKQIAHIADITAENPDEPIARVAGARTLLIVPMLKERALIGVIAIYRQEVLPFTDKQIELVKSFAAQAVIAIENARLLNELRQRTDDLSESLEQQTATSEVLQVISSSPGELEPVFQAMLENATRICEAKFGTLFLRESDTLRRVATHNAPPNYAAFIANEPLIDRRLSHSIDQLIKTKQAVHVADMAVYEPEAPVTKFGRARTLVTVPMLKENELIGAIGIYRQEVWPFTDKQIALLQNFAAQAVIAIENTRLLTELRQRTTDLTVSLEQQTATANVLRVISSSPGELGPVFDAVLDSATRLCEANFGILYRYEGDAFLAIALRGAPPAFAEFQQRAPIHPTPASGLGRIVSTQQPVHIIDTMAEQRYLDGDPYAVTAVKLSGSRTLIFFPMLKDDDLIGAITIYRREVRPFTDKQIELLQNFAAQAVIAIENARLLSELRQSLEQQTATADVLGVISSSPGELNPVFKIILENATRICEAKFGTLYLTEGDGYRTVAMHNVPSAFAEFIRQRGPFKPPPGIHLDRVMRT